MTETFYTQGEKRTVAHKDGLANNGDFDITPAKLGDQSRYVVTTYIVGGSVDVKYLVDKDQTGDFASPDTNITIESFDAAGVSEGNATPIASDFSAIRITNTSGGSIDVVVFVERDDEGDE